MPQNWEFVGTLMAPLAGEEKLATKLSRSVVKSKEIGVAAVPLGLYEVVADLMGNAVVPKVAVQVLFLVKLAFGMKVISP